MAAESGGGSVPWFQIGKGLYNIWTGSGSGTPLEITRAYNEEWAKFYTDPDYYGPLLGDWKRQLENLPPNDLTGTPRDQYPINPYTGKPWFIEGVAAAVAPVISPPVITAPPITPPIVTTPPAVIPTAPPVLEGEILTPSQIRAYELAKSQLQTAELLRKWGGRGNVGGALKLGAALWSEFGAEIQAENAAKQRAQNEADELLRRGPATRRAATTKSGKIKRPAVTPPIPPKPPAQAVPNQAKRNAALVQSATEAAKAVSQAADIAEITVKAKRISTSQAQKPAQTRTRSSWTLPGLLAGLVPAATALLTAGQKAGLVPTLRLQTAPETAPGSGFGGITRIAQATAEGAQKCWTVCRNPNKKRKKKGKPKACVDKSKLEKLIGKTKLNRLIKN